MKKSLAVVALVLWASVGMAGVMVLGPADEDEFNAPSALTLFPDRDECTQTGQPCSVDGECCSDSCVDDGQGGLVCEAET